MGGGSFIWLKKSIRILIADDNREFCELLKEFINGQEDLNLIGIAYNGQEALQMIRENNPDVVVLDIIMPHWMESEYWRNLHLAAPETDQNSLC